MRQQFTAAVYQPFLPVGKGLANDKQRKKVGVEVERAGAEKPTLGRIDEEAGHPVDGKPEQPLCRRASRIEDVWLDPRRRVNLHALDTEMAVLSQFRIHLRDVRLESAQPFGVLLATLGRTQQQPTPVQFDQCGDIPLRGFGDEFLGEQGCPWVGRRTFRVQAKRFILERAEPSPDVQVRTAVFSVRRSRPETKLTRRQG
ncbi:MAG: hypothetical protein A3K19_18865 [Lentisphaerae bacterium RIFOXYB12_FULL_65_16]|nr:MAG: hypothetical protein A3K18_12940 [Lentisphaerae bacterium RIFOXYA12_64_32]OGV86828.1 MAG: hypothetical protein A3K19_18865 [Lentisphaerae bacterium RIFOXYB12_FULL_65_16]